MRMLVWIMLACAALSPVRAADRVETGPVPAWVRPVAMPAATGPVRGSISYLLADRQVRLEPGRTSIYGETAIRIETAEGLAAGNISLSWQPGTQTVTVHRLTIERGGKSIDLLASGQAFTVLRREANLESAMLDGELTANFQPEGLQVGDIVHLATTTTSSDPTYGGHVEHRFDAAYRVRVGRQHFRAQWPASMAVRLRQTSGLPPLEPRRVGGVVTAELTVDGLEPAATPSQAPQRYRRPRLVELSDFGDWAQLAGLFRPLYDRAATLPADSPLQAEIARIRAASTDPKARAEAALALVQGQVRYVALLMGDGNFVPADATLTWQRRFGDCKAKSALLLAVLRGLDIAADPVVVNADDGDGLDERLPMIGLFNHVIVRATIGGRSYWLDGTRTGDARLDLIDTPDMGWGLPLVANAVPVRLLPEAPERPLVETRLRIDARNGITLPAPAELEVVFRGDDAYRMQLGDMAASAEERERGLRDFWKKTYAFVDVRTTGAGYDPDRREYRIEAKGDARLDWEDKAYWLTDTGLGDAEVSFERDAREDQNAPFAVTYPYFWRTTQTILLPPGIEPDDADVDETAGGIHYRRKASFVDNVYTMESSTRSIAPDFPAREAPAAQKTIRALATRHVALRIGRDHEQSPAEIEAVLARTAETAEELNEQGKLLFDLARYEMALARFDQAAKLEPDNAIVLARRGVTRLRLGDYAAADRDFAAAEAIDSDSLTLAWGRGLLAQQTDKAEEAVRYYSKVIEKIPGDSEVLVSRAEMYVDLKRYPAALDDLDRAIKLRPDWIRPSGLRAKVLHRMGKTDQALATIDRMLADHPGERMAAITAAWYHARFGSRKDALRLYSRALDMEKTVDTLLDRSYFRPWDDVAGRLDDVATALRIDPGNAAALREKVDLQRRNGDLAGMTTTLSTALKRHSNDVILLGQRAQSLWLDGRKVDARKGFAAARAAAENPTQLANLCWIRAISDIDLTEALADCDAALSRSPNNAAVLESRGFVLVKLGRLDDAILSYDRALAEDPAMAEALLGRAVAWKRKGDQARSDADFAAATARNEDIVAQYHYYGMSF
ncbi:DUF3857 domain-containing protein [Rhizorhabdus wittichii]